VQRICVVARQITVDQQTAQTQTDGRYAVPPRRASGPAPAGDSPLAFEPWVAARGAALLRLAIALTGDRADADDVVAEALSRALVRWDRISRADDVDAYVRRMVVNAHTSRWRRFRRREQPVAQVWAPGTAAQTPGPEAAGEAAADRARLWAACATLPDAQRVAVVLRFYEDLTYAEIADLTGVREGSARSRVSRGLAALRIEMGEREEHGDG